jgi:hypothetical protein
MDVGNEAAIGSLSRVASNNSAPFQREDLSILRSFSNLEAPVIVQRRRLFSERSTVSWKERAE